MYLCGKFKVFYIFRYISTVMDFSASIDFRPKLFGCLRDYSMDKLKADVTAGIVVGIVALPLAIAFGIASGVSPTIGLITAIIGCLLYTSDAADER